MEPITLTYLIFILTESVWLTPFFVISAVLAYAQYKLGIERTLDSRLKVANVFIVTAIAARSISLAFKHNLQADIANAEVVMVVFALVIALIAQQVGRMASENRINLENRFVKLFAFISVLVFSIGIIAVASPIIDKGNLFKVFEWKLRNTKIEPPVNYKAKLGEEWIFGANPVLGTPLLDLSLKTSKKWIFSNLYSGDGRPLSALEIARASRLFEFMGPVFVPSMLAKRTAEKVPKEKIPEIIEYANVSPLDLLPKSNQNMVVATITRIGENAMSAQIIPHSVKVGDNMTGKVIITALYNQKTANEYFNRQPSERRVGLAGIRVVLYSSEGNLSARWTKRRFAFEAIVDWSNSDIGRAPLTLLQNIVEATVESTKLKVD